MQNPLQARINWLFGADRQVYGTHRTPPAEHDGHAACCRCGGEVLATGRGTRSPIYFTVRDRGSVKAHRQIEAIHRGCIPTAGQELRPNIKPRRRTT